MSQHTTEMVRVAASGAGRFGGTLIHSIRMVKESSVVLRKAVWIFKKKKQEEQEEEEQRRRRRRSSSRRRT